MLRQETQQSMRQRRSSGCKFLQTAAKKRQMADNSKMKLGKLAPRHDPRTLRLERYLLPELAPPPPSCFWSLMHPDGWGMMLNDQLGCCTIAGKGHAVQTWTEVVNQRWTPTDDQILADYQAVDGYRGGLGSLYDSASDQGGIEIDVLNKWRKEGFFGHQLSAFASVNAKNSTAVKQAISLFGGAYIGVGLPITAQSQDIWDVNGDGPDAAEWSWGGHCVWVLGYDADFVYFISWGKLMRMTWRFWMKYVDECWALLSPDFITVKGLAPSGFDMPTLNSDLQLVTR